MKALPAMLLLVLLVTTAINLALTRHEARHLFAELEDLRAEARALDETYGRLLLERATWSSHARVDELARTELHMQSPAIVRVVLVKP